MKKFISIVAVVCAIAFTAQARPIKDSRFAFSAVASGQTSQAVTMPGITTSSRCVASLNEVSTNSITIRAVVPTRDTVTVTVSGDPGASNADFTIWCAN